METQQIETLKQVIPIEKEGKKMKNRKTKRLVPEQKHTKKMRKVEMKIFQSKEVFLLCYKHKKTKKKVNLKRPTVTNKQFRDSKYTHHIMLIRASLIRTCPSSFLK